MELPLSSIFYTTHPFVKKLTTLKTSGEKVFCYFLLTMELFFFRNSKLRNGMASLIKRSSQRRYSIRKGVLRNFAKFTGKHLCQSLFFNKVASLRPPTSWKSLWNRCFPVNFMLKLLVFVTSFFIISNIMIKTSFQEQHCNFNS